MAPEIQPRNPLRTYQFRIAVLSLGASAPAAYVAGVKSVSGLRTQISAWETFEGGNNLHRYANPNKVTWDPVTLEQGLALDETFERWAEAVIRYSATGEVDRAEPVKRQVMIDVWDENAHPDGPPAPAQPPRPSTTNRSPISSNPAVDIRKDQVGKRCRRYRLHNAWISKYQPLPKLDSLTSEVALLSVELVHEGWVKEEFTTP